MTQSLLKIRNCMNSLKITLAALLTILIGGVLLSLPISYQSGQEGSVFDRFLHLLHLCRSTAFDTLGEELTHCNTEVLRIDKKQDNLDACKIFLPEAEPED